MNSNTSPALSALAQRIGSQGTPPIVLTIAGSDPSGGAGIQADLKTFSALGVYGASVITAVAVQNTRGVRNVHSLPAAVVRDQLRTVLDDLDVRAIKIGMIGSREIAHMLEGELREVTCPIVLDPIIHSSSNANMIDTTDARSFFAELIPKSYLITPNIPEAQELSGIVIDSIEPMERAAAHLLEIGAANVLIKGGHATGDDLIDMLVTPDQEYFFPSPRIETKNLHGTGCTLSSAIAAALALGFALPEALRIAKEYLTGAIESAKNKTIGHGNGPLDHEWMQRAFEPKEIEHEILMA